MPQNNKIIVVGSIVEHASIHSYWTMSLGWVELVVFTVQCYYLISVRVCEVAVLGSGDQVERPLTLGLGLLSVFCRRSLEAGGR